MNAKNLYVSILRGYLEPKTEQVATVFWFSPPPESLIQENEKDFHSSTREMPYLVFVYSQFTFFLFKLLFLLLHKYKEKGGYGKWERVLEIVPVSVWVSE